MERANASESNAFSVCTTIFPRADLGSDGPSSRIAGVINSGVKHCARRARDWQEAFLMVASDDSKKAQTAFHTFPSSPADAWGSASLYAIRTFPRSPSQAGAMAASDLGGGEERTAFRMLGISETTLESSSFVGAERRSDRIEYALCERKGFPRRGNDKSRMTIAERDWKKQG
jgi:hypothetical protein